MNQFLPLYSLLKFKGSFLAKRVAPATVISLILSDVVKDPLDVVASGPIMPDPTTFGDAIKVLERYGLWTEVPEHTRAVLLNGKKGRIPETPKPHDAVFNRFITLRWATTFIVLSCLRRTSERWSQCTVSFVLHEGEAKHIIIMLGAMAREKLTSGILSQNPLA